MASDSHTSTGPSEGVIGTVYLLHFERAFGHARHYCGWTSLSLEQRLKRHNTSQGARLLLAVRRAGIKYTVAQVWENQDRNFERKLKNRGGLARVCPLCRQMKSKNTIAAICYA